MLDIFRQAGWVAWPLGLCSVLTFGILFERLFTLGQVARQEEETFTAMQGEGAGESAIAAGGTAPVAQILASLRPLRKASDDARLQAVEIGLGRQRLRLRRYMTVLATIGNTAPFIGLFGTVLGVMSAFRSMAHAGLSGETMASGIAEALSATALGLLVAIPAVFAYNYLIGRAQLMLLQIHGHVIELLPQLGESGE